MIMGPDPSLWVMRSLSLSFVLYLRYRLTVRRDSVEGTHEVPGRGVPSRGWWTKTWSQVTGRPRLDSGVSEGSLVERAPRRAGE